MNRIIEHFKNKPERNLNIYFTAGFPELNDTGRIIETLSKNKVDLIEIGMPYSDPMADGPVIQSSSSRSLKNGMKLNILLEQLQEARSKTEVPFILMGYYNQVLQYGDEAFFKKAKEVGVDGFILPDLPFEMYEKLYRDLFEELDLGISFLVSPQTSEARIREIDRLTRGFIYLVSSNIITGGSGSNEAHQEAYFKKIKEMDLKNPYLIGFGISDKAGVENAYKNANGAIIGSAFIGALEKEGNLEENITQFIQQVRP